MNELHIAEDTAHADNPAESDHETDSFFFLDPYIVDKKDMINIYIRHPDFLAMRADFLLS